MQTFDHIIVGTGQATGTLISGLPEDETIAVIEGGKVGGTCVNFGCTPTKALIASAKVAHMVSRAGDYGVQVTGSQVDFAQVMARMNEIRDNSGMVSWLESLEHVTLLREFASFTGPRTLQVGDKEITGERIYLNVGARARALPIPGLDEVTWLDNKSILELTELPEHLMIIGGSYVGLEFAQMFLRFGAAVTVLEAGPQLMSREDRDVAECIQQILKDEGITFHLNAKVQRVTQENQYISVSIKQGDKELTINGSHLLLAAGRVPNSDRLNLEAAGIKADKRGYIEVDDHLRTNVDNVFALGDVNGQGAFTHTSVNDAEIVLDYLGGGSRKLSDRIPTYAMFIDPPLARVGLSEKEALEKGHKVFKAAREMKQIARAKEMGETQGFVKLLIDGDTDLIIGATILGVHGDEVINMFTAFMYSGLPCKTYRKAVLIHPTVAELMPWILDDLEAV
jgi:pyruvate/2-oxoglutarate dehydrogenase complex dihydrolipoamide dehydrogenase (E3) component